MLQRKFFAEFKSQTRNGASHASFDSFVCQLVLSTYIEPETPFLGLSSCLHDQQRIGDTQKITT